MSNEELKIDLPDDAFDSGFDPANVQEVDDKKEYLIFCKLCFLNGLGVKRFATGEKLTLPGVEVSVFENGQPTGEMKPFQFPAMKIQPGSEHKLFTMIAHKTDKDGKEYDKIFNFHNWNEYVQIPELDEAGNKVLNEKGYTNYINALDSYELDENGKPKGKPFNERNAFAHLQFPVLAELGKNNPVGHAKLLATGPALFRGQTDKAWVYASYIETETGYDKGRELRHYLKDITIFSTKEEWEAARSENGKVSTAPSFGHYPKAWESDPTALQTYIKDAAAGGKSHQQIVAEGMIEGEAINGQPVNVRALLAEVLNVPEPMVKL